jgi:3-hydroxyisobutyrate dehydrogenase-like beta-hydroxyacid dehydrogenase
MVHRLVAAGQAVRVLGRSVAARDELAAAGLDAVSDLAAVTAGAEAVLVCVYSDEQVHRVAPGLLAEMAPGSVLVVHTTVSPRTIEALVPVGRRRDIDIVDAPVSGGPPDVAAGRLTLFVGGADEAVARVRPALAAYGDPILHVGQSGAGQRVKLVNNAVFAAQLGLLGHAVRLGQQWGVDEAVLLDALGHGSAASRALAGAARRGSVAGFAASAGPFLDKDLRVVRAAAAELGGELGALDPALTALANLVAG